MHPAEAAAHTLDTIRQHPGRVEKEYLLLHHHTPEMQFILRTMFLDDPHGYSDTTSLVLSGLPDTTPQDWHTWWKNVVSYFLRPEVARFSPQTLVTAAPDALAKDLLISMLTQTPRAGFGIRTLEKLFPDHYCEFKVQLAKPFDARHLTFPCVVEPKFDGVRAIYLDGKYLSRYGKPLLGPELNVPSNVVLDGELVARDFQNTLSAVRVGGELKYYVFDTIPRVEWISRQFISTLLDRWKTPYFRGKPGFTSVNTRWVYSQIELDQVHACNLADGFEGSMVKLNVPYELKRSHSWMKIKPVLEMDVLVTGWSYGFGKYSNSIGVLHCKTSNDQGLNSGMCFDLGSGFSDSDRVAWINLKFPMVCEIRYQELTNSGVPRFARFVRWRPDKETL